MNKNLKKIIMHNKEALVNSNKDLKAIFDIMFHAKGNVLCEGNDGFRVYKFTYGDIHKRIITAAQSLYKKIGATHSFVALEMENSADWIIAFWAILMSGNKPYLVNMRYPQSLTEGIFKTLNIKYIICEKGTALNGTAIAVSSLNTADEAIPEDIFENEIAFSSSATSMNEVICFYTGFQIAEEILNFESIVKQSPKIAKHYKGQLKQLTFLPFYHVFGLFAVYFWFTFFGRTLVFLKDYSADTILKTCRRHNVTHIFAVPMLWHTIEKQVLAAAKEGGEKQVKKLEKGIKAMTALQNISPDIGSFIAKRVMSQVTDKLFGPSVMFCITGGSYLRDSALRLLNGIGYNLHNGYGMSEIGITSVELRRKPKQLNENSIGRPFDSVEYKLTDANELLVKGSSLCSKKLINGEEIKLDGWFNTGDIVEERDGSYFILGRMGDLVIGDNGENVNPDSVEKFFSVPSAKAFCVLGIKDNYGETLSMIVSINEFASINTIQKIRDEIYSINEALPLACQIKRFYFTNEELAPPTAVKVSRTQLIKKINEGLINLIPFNEIDSTLKTDGECSPLFSEVRSIIAKALDIDEGDIIPASHIFHDLNATSIQYFSILSALAERFSIADYNKEDAYRYTLKEMCEYIERHL